MAAQETVEEQAWEIVQVKSRWWDLTAAVLLIIALFTAASRLDATNWTNHLSIIPFLAVIGAVSGIALGLSRFRPGIIFFFGILYGLFFISWQLGLSLFSLSLPWKARVVGIGDRVGEVISKILTGQPVSDSILFLIVMSTLFWVIGLLAGYILSRHGNAWMAIIPAGLVMFIIHTFDARVPRKSIYLAVYIFFGLVLIARFVYLQNQSRWKRTKTAMPPHLGLDFIRFALAAVLIITVLAWSTPALGQTIPAMARAVQPVRQYWANLRDRWQDAFASLRSSNTIYTAYYGNSANLGRGNALSDAPVFAVKLPERTSPGTRYYWRAMVYDTYRNGTWTNTLHIEQEFDPEGALWQIPETEGRWKGTFEFLPFTHIKTIYGPSQPFWVNQNATAEFIENPDGTVELASFHANEIIKPREIYQVQSSLNNATIRLLQQSGTEYPSWISERYLELPETITPRTIQLAEEITASLETPYDKAVAITEYLRNNIEYTERVPNIPENQEPIDWFLFDLQKGFCNYYATAEVILLRAVGIPARWSVGYAQGERLEDGRFLTRQRDAHSWPEVYFPGVGWVEFEPTVSQENIFRLSGEPIDNRFDREFPQEELDELRRQQREEMDLGRPDAAITNTNSDRIWPKLLIGAGILLATSGLGYLFWKYRKRISIPPIPVLIEKSFLKIGIRPPKAIQHWAWRASLPPISKYYQEINRALDRLESPPNLTQTPAERSNLLGNILPTAGAQAERLVLEYQVAIFSQGLADSNAANDAAAQIRLMSMKAYLRDLPKRLQVRLSRNKKSSLDKSRKVN
jgi:transglutaminase-like putative cysteine protease